MTLDDVLPQREAVREDGQTTLALDLRMVLLNLSQRECEVVVESIRAREVCVRVEFLIQKGGDRIGVFIFHITGFRDQVLDEIFVKVLL